jgi:hypothetical protein
MHPGIGAVDDVDIAAVVDVDIVGLDRDLAALLAVGLDKTLVGRLGDRRDVIGRPPPPTTSSRSEKNTVLRSPCCVRWRGARLCCGYAGSPQPMSPIAIEREVFVVEK